MARGDFNYMLQRTIGTFIAYASRNMIMAILLFSVFLIGFLWTGVYYKVQSERQFEMENAIKATANLTQAFEEYTSRTLKETENISRFIKDEYEKGLHEINVSQFVAKQINASQASYALSIVDEHGDTLISNISPLPTNMKDREHFIVHEKNDTGQFYIGKPILGRATGKWYVPLTRRINKPDGSFGGIVVVSLYPYYYNEFYRNVDLGENGIIVLIGRDNIVRARKSSQSDDIGQDLKSSALAEQLKVSDRGHYIAVSPIDGIKRLYNYRALADYPLIVSVGVAEAEIMHAVNRRIAGYYSVAGLITLMIVGFTLVLLRIAARQKKTEAALMEARNNLEFQVRQRTQELFATNIELQTVNQELEAEISERKTTGEKLSHKEKALSLAAELAHLGPWEYNIETELFEFGDEFYVIYGTDTAREGRFMSGDKYISNFVHPDDACLVKATIKTERSADDPDLEHRIIRRDGEVRMIVVRANTIRDADGRVVRFYGANQDITAQKQAEESLRKQAENIRQIAYFDMLTGLPNRAQLYEWLREEMKKASTGESTGVVLFIDADDLKMVNDTFGHTYGDVLIRTMAKRITDQVGENALVGRIGGDEFLVILPGEVNRENITRIVDRIIDGVNQEIEVAARKFHITASAGIAFYPEDGETAEEIFKNVDNAMYAAKKSGKNCWRVYEAVMQKEAYDTVLLINSLRNAIDHGEFSLHYQPQVRLSDGETVSFEALLRWQSAEYGSVPPARFIPLAEQSGLIQAIGQWVLKEACSFIRQLNCAGFGHIYVAVNVSPNQLSAHGFIDSVRENILNAGIEPHQLGLEITENALIVSLEDGICKLEQLQTMGVRLSLDDFGTGYSSLTYLRRLPVNTVKIDKSFIDTIMAEGDQKSIIGTIIAMVHTMQMTVVAEGAETKEQLAYLTQCGCDHVQGYVISRPLPEDEAIKFLSRRG